jgi:hypothetical protein
MSKFVKDEIAQLKAEHLKMNEWMKKVGEMLCPLAGEKRLILVLFDITNNQIMCFEMVKIKKSERNSNFNIRHKTF